MALKELETERIINRRKGIEPFIAKPKIKERFFHKLSGFYQDLSEKGFKVSTKVLYQEINPCSEKVANFLEISEVTNVTKIQRLRYINDNPIQLVTSYIPYDFCLSLADIDLTDRSLYEFLESTCGKQSFEFAQLNEFDYIEIHNVWGKNIEDFEKGELKALDQRVKDHGLKVSCI